MGQWYIQKKRHTGVGQLQHCVSEYLCPCTTRLLTSTVSKMQHLPLAEKSVNTARAAHTRSLVQAERPFETI